ncbi:methylated-DNA--[protein]-cysteine S-methyltransferase [Methanolacinia paynteri]|uniref:methylated-DNA--[protein]-cysteine S-methyltransferase n=1 Tax=Methanolacinia paynteri TaxID=230356 RepID=UPI00064FFA9C|nr:MGMT family protein [Methanolacinia paynteri]
MVMRKGACRFGYWWVHVEWSGDTIYRIQFSRKGDESYIPPPIRQFVKGKSMQIAGLKSIALSDGHPYREIYESVREIPYGEVRTYSEIGAETGFHARTIGVAMRRNPTPLIIPCHRVVAKNGIGGFTPEIDIKKALLEMEKKNSTTPITKKDKNKLEEL